MRKLFFVFFLLAETQIEICVDANISFILWNICIISSKLQEKKILTAEDHSSTDFVQNKILLHMRQKNLFASGLTSASWMSFNLS